MIVLQMNHCKSLLLEFKNKPNDVELSIIGTSEIVIKDDDSEWPLYCNY